MSRTPDPPTVLYAKRKFLVVEATAEGVPDPLVSEGEIRVCVPLQIPAPATAVGTAIVLYC